jgi:hypothetical protein
VDVVTGLLGALVIGHLLACMRRGGGRWAAPVGAATLASLVVGALLLSGTTGHWAADLSSPLASGRSAIDLGLTSAGVVLLFAALGLVARRRGEAGALAVAAGLVACLGGAGILEVVGAAWTGGHAAAATSVLGTVVRSTLLCGTGGLLLGAGLRTLATEHALRWAPAGSLLGSVVASEARHGRVAAEPSVEFAA